jgi:hypothetical protein
VAESLAVSSHWHSLRRSALLLIENWSWRTVGLLALCVWGFSRAYYFAFYVIERWVDPQFKFSGLGHFFAWWWRGK